MTPYNHPAFQREIRTDPHELTTRGAYADWIEENDPGSAHPDTLKTLREHRGPVWVHHPDDGPVEAGPRLSWEEIERENGPQYNWTPPSREGGHHHGFFPAFVHTGELGPDGDPYSGPKGHHFVTSRLGEDPYDPFHPPVFDVWKYDPKTKGVGSLYVTEDRDVAHHTARELSGLPDETEYQQYGGTQYETPAGEGQTPDADPPSPLDYAWGEDSDLDVTGDNHDVPAPSDDQYARYSAPGLHYSHDPGPGGVIPGDAVSPPTRNPTHYSDKSTIAALLRNARQNPDDVTTHGIIADALEEYMPDSPLHGLIRQQYGLGEHQEAGPKNNLYHDPFYNSWDGTFPYAARLGKHGPFSLYLTHEGGEDQGQNQRYVVHAVSDLPGSQDSGYNFEFPHEQSHLIPRMFPEASGYLAKDPTGWTPEHHAQQAWMFDAAMDHEENERNDEFGNDEDEGDDYCRYDDPGGDGQFPDDDPTMYGTAEEMLAAVHENPLEATTHHALADYLEENGQPGEADFRRRMANWVQSYNPYQPSEEYPDHPWTLTLSPSNRGPFGIDVWSNLGIDAFSPDASGTSRHETRQLFDHPDFNYNHVVRELRFRNWPEMEEDLRYTLRNQKDENHWMRGDQGPRQLDEPVDLGETGYSLDYDETGTTPGDQPEPLDDTTWGDTYGGEPGTDRKFAGYGLDYAGPQDPGWKSVWEPVYDDQNEFSGMNVWTLVPKEGKHIPGLRWTMVHALPVSSLEEAALMMGVPARTEHGLPSPEFADLHWNKHVGRYLTPEELEADQAARRGYDEEKGIGLTPVSPQRADELTGNYAAYSDDTLYHCGVCPPDLWEQLREVGEKLGIHPATEYDDEDQYPDEEGEDQLNTGPEDDDLRTDDGHNFYQGRRLVVSVPEGRDPVPFLNRWMEQQGYFPGVWMDYGGRGDYQPFDMTPGPPEPVSVDEMHPSYRFTRLGALLRQHSADQNEAGQLIRSALLSDPRRSAETMPLHLLRDYMQENPDHPLAGRFNWETLPENFELDNRISEAANYPDYHDGINLLTAHMYPDPDPRFDRYQDMLRSALGHYGDNPPPPGEVRRSLHRVISRADHSDRDDMDPEETHDYLTDDARDAIDERADHPDRYSRTDYLEPPEGIQDWKNPGWLKVWESGPLGAIIHHLTPQRDEFTKGNPLTWLPVMKGHDVTVDDLLEHHFPDNSQLDQWHLRNHWGRPLTPEELKLNDLDRGAFDLENREEYSCYGALDDPDDMPWERSGGDPNLTNRQYPAEGPSREELDAGWDRYKQSEQTDYALHEDRHFHDLIHENPDEKTHALVYADWLQENGREHQAEMIRQNVEEYGEAGYSWASGYPFGPDHPADYRIAGTYPVYPQDEDGNIVGSDISGYRVGLDHKTDDQRALTWGSKVMTQLDAARMLRGLRSEGTEIKGPFAKDALYALEQHEKQQGDQTQNSRVEYSHHSNFQHENLEPGQFHKRVWTSGSYFRQHPQPGRYLGWTLIPSPRPTSDGKRLWVMAEGQPVPLDELDEFLKGGHHEYQSYGSGVDVYKHKLDDHLFQPIDSLTLLRSGTSPHGPDYPGIGLHPDDWASREVEMDWLRDHPEWDETDRYGFSNINKIEDEVTKIKRRLGSAAYQPPKPPGEPDWEQPPNPWERDDPVDNSRVQYGADQSDVVAMLHEMSQPHHNHTRWATPGHPDADWNRRLITADALQDLGRDEEADLLRKPDQHVVVRDGQVLPGRFDRREIEQRTFNLARSMFENDYYADPPDVYHFDTTPHGQPQYPGMDQDEYENGPFVPLGHGEVRVHTIPDFPEEPVVHANVHHSALGNYMADEVMRRLDSDQRTALRAVPELREAEEALRHAPFEEADPRPTQVQPLTEDTTPDWQQGPNPWEDDQQNMSRYSDQPGHRIEPSQGDGFKITTPHGYIDYRPRPDDDTNEIWWVESHKPGHGSELVDLMQQNHPAGNVAWGVTSQSGKGLMQRWHAANPDVGMITGPHEGQFDPFGHDEDDGDDSFLDEEDYCRYDEGEFTSDSSPDADYWGGKRGQTGGWHPVKVWG